MARLVAIAASIVLMAVALAGLAADLAGWDARLFAALVWAPALVAVGANITVIVKRAGRAREAG